MSRFVCTILLLSAGNLFSFPNIKMLTPVDYIEIYKDAALKEMQRYNIPASVTLAQAIVESKYGNSNLALNANNHFGIKCHKEWAGPTFTMDDDEKDECFRKYGEVLDSYEDHSMFLISRPRYAFLFQLPKSDYIAWAKGLKEAGYATHPKYAEMIIEIIEKYELYKLDDVCLNPYLYAKRSEQPSIERRYTSDYLFYVLKFNESGFAIPHPGNSFFSIMKDLDIHAEHFVKQIPFEAEIESSSVRNEVEKTKPMILFTNEDLKKLSKKNDLTGMNIAEETRLNKPRFNYFGISYFRKRKSKK